MKDQFNQNQVNQQTKINSSLDDTLFKFIDLDEKFNSNATIIGKTRHLLLDIIQRFFKNYVALISLIIVLSICLVCLIIPLTSGYSSTAKISNAVSLVWLQELPPSFQPIVSRTVSIETYNGMVKQLNEAKIDPSIFFIRAIEIKEAKSWDLTFDIYWYLKICNNNQSISTLIGTNSFGVDLWTRTWAAARDSFTLAFLVATFDAIIGIIVGCFLGFNAGKWIDTVLSRIVEVINNIPTIIWFLVLMTLIGKSNINNFSIFLVLVSLGWTYMVSAARLWMITVKDQEFILAAKAIGCSTTRQIFVHGLPMIIGKLATNYVRRIVTVIMSVSSLVFLGFLDASQQPNLGTLLKEAIPLIGINYWALMLPSIILLVFSLTMQFVANGLHDALDPKVGRGK